jgi:hypothetical protein
MTSTLQQPTAQSTEQPTEQPAAAPEEQPAADTVTCPECGQPALVEWRTSIPSTGGPVEHVKIYCEDGHRFFMPVAGLG